MSRAIAPASRPPHRDLPLRQPWRLALSNLLQDVPRFALSAAAVALPVMLMLFLLGMRTGVLRSAVIYLDHAPGSLAVMPVGVTSTGAGSGQLLSGEAVRAVAATPGVARATPVLLTLAIPELHGTKEVIRLVGYDAALGGGPWDLAQGRAPAADGEVVLDRVIAERHGVSVGDSFDVAGRSLTVVGLSDGTGSWIGSYAFARKSFVESLMLAPGAASLVLVTPAAGQTTAGLAASLRAVPGVDVLPKSQLMANDQQIIAGIFDQVILLMVAAAFIVGALVIGMVIYTETTERRGEYGILKAIGARNGLLYRVVAAQALVAAGAGAALGVGLAFAAGRLVVTVKPQFLVAIGPPAIVITLLAGLAMALAGALLPARAVAGLPPADVFRR
ncbi:MAG: ABC transporter permease [Chloroflexota bacterium]|nr:ABC transporter permease [Chloroflexota bacterium]